MPGSGFASPDELGNAAAAAPGDVGETEWNMRVAPRARGSLLRAMARDVAGGTSPMLYVAMLYSWFAWHVEDHELHSLNFLHFGKSKTWYGVPRDAMLAFEETVRVHGYADDLNAIMAFQTLNEKTTVLSPEVLLSAGVPCCRLVQKAGEFVITFPGAYHSGFSHGFNCGEASNIATPHWLQVAKEAAIRRASTNCGPMVSHYQLLYELALSLRPREPKNFHSVPRSSRLRDKNKNESDIMVKENFVGSVTENNNLLSLLLDKSSCIIVPNIAFPIPSFPLTVESEVTVKQRFTTGPCSISEQGVENIAVDHVAVDKITDAQDMSGSLYDCEPNLMACSSRKLYETKNGTQDVATLCLSNSDIQSRGMDEARSHSAGGILDQGRLPCVQCGILSFACVAIIQPKEAAVQFIMSRECISSSAKHGEIASHDTSNWINQSHDDIGPPPGLASGTDDNVKHAISSAHVSDRCRQLYGSNTDGCPSALGLLASAYDSSDSDEETTKDISKRSEKNDLFNQSTNTQISSASYSSTVQRQKTNSHFQEEECEARASSLMKLVKHNSQSIRDADICLGNSGASYSGYLDLVDDITTSVLKSSSDTCVRAAKASVDPDVLTMLKYNKDSCRMHVFCLEHALETWTQLQQIGGANIMLLCHPEYPRAETAARVIADELGIKHDWKDITFKEATEEEIRKIKLALQDEDAEPTGSDWAVKMGINIYYSAKQSKSPLYSKQIPYNSIIYKAFGQENPDSLIDYEGQKSGSTKKKVAGWWCGKVWMSNQVHPLLAREREEQDGSIVYSKAMSTAISHGKVQDEASTRCNTINRSLSKRTSRRKKGGSAEKSKAKKKRATASDEANMHYSELGISSEVIHDQLENSDDRDKHGDGDEIEEATNAQKYQQHDLQNVTRKSSSKKRKDEKKKGSYRELYDKDDDVSYWLNTGSRDDSTIGNSDNTRQQSPDPLKVKSGGKLQGNKRKSNKYKSNDDLLNEDNKFQKMNKTSSSKKQKNEKINRQYQEDQNKDDHMLDVDVGDEATLDSEDKITDDKTEDMKVKSKGKLQSSKRKTSKRQTSDGLRNGNRVAKFACDIEGCDMSFSTQQDLLLHKRDICPVKGCKKKFFCHKYLLQHRKVHMDERPLKCMWKGCKKAFKWPWARTEHMRVHTGVRPYECQEPGCSQTFRFVSDFSRHKRKTGHSCDKRRKKST
uniref:JmjC domain-containing protein n=1 Tax=Oryza brachyantha TaxID=4533 RepID=J3NCM8_ORYBR